MVDVFRRYDDLPGVLAETLALNPRPKYLWLQQGLWHEEVGEQAQAAGLRVVMDRCLKVDYAPAHRALIGAISRTTHRSSCLASPTRSASTAVLGC